MKELEKGAIYRYKTITGKLTGIQEHAGVTTIFIEGKDIQDTIKKATAKKAEWIEEFELITPADEVIVYEGKKEEHSNLPSVTPQNIISEIRDNLLEDIRRVRNDKAYIPQAKQACNTTNTLLNLVKLEIQIKKSR